MIFRRPFVDTKAWADLSISDQYPLPLIKQKKGNPKKQKKSFSQFCKFLLYILFIWASFISAQK